MLNRPYPLQEVTFKNIIGIFLAGVFVAGFLLIFQPFGIFLWQTTQKSLKIAGYGLISVLVLLIDFYGIRKYWAGFFTEKNWKVWKEIVWTLFILLSVTIGNYLYNILILQSASFQVTDFLIALFTTFSIGVFPTIGFVLTNYIIRLRKYSQPIAVNPAPDYPETQFTLLAENGKDHLVLQTREVLFIESTDNYCTIYVVKNGKVTKELIRSSLTRLEDQIPARQIVRCHRSYLVNLLKVIRISGNAQGYKLHFENWPEPIPVARKYSQIVSPD